VSKNSRKTDLLWYFQLAHVDEGLFREMPTVEYSFASCVAPSGDRKSMRIGIVRTVESPCRCAESVILGLKALGHEILLADSEEIEDQALSLAESCDLVIDHTDTFRGRGLFRSLVRLMLENCGARVAGSGPEACLLADNKAAAKERLMDAGIPVPPGICIHSKTWELPGWLMPPLVLKPAFEHMSRGVRVARTELEARQAASLLLDSLKQPVLVEAFIPGRELAVSLLSGPEELQVLPPLEWCIGSGDTNILTEEFKLMDRVGADRGVERAKLSPELREEIETLSRQAFRALGLRDYGRFDLRLSPNGTPFFLEANTTPSLEPLEALAMSARWAGLEYEALVERILSAALGRSGSLQAATENLMHVRMKTGTIELEIAKGVCSPPQSTVELAQMLDVQPGERVLELGCGSGLLSIAAAKLGAHHVTATDLDVNALQAARRNALRNGVADRIDFYAGSWYEALGAYPIACPADRFDVILATPPQTPGPAPFGPKYGGPEGTRNLSRILQGAPAFLDPQRGRLWLMVISLANPDEVRRRLRECFSEVSVIRETDRSFTAEKYDAMKSGLFDYICRLRSLGKSHFADSGNGQYAFRNLFIRAAGPQLP
jgi:D-alanine-D-alanine ligase-like ATP-grasp enzyme/SAM-dependent methyltransferase